MDLIVAAVLTFGAVLFLHLIMQLNWFLIPAHIRAKRKDLPKGTLGWPLIGELMDYASASRTVTPHSWTNKRIQKYGSLFLSHLFGSPMIILASQESLKHVLSQESVAFGTSYPTAIVRVVGDEAILWLHGERHKNMRRLYQPLTTPENLKGLMANIEQLCLSCLGKLEDSCRPLPLHVAVRQFTANVVLQMFFGLPPGTLSSQILECFSIMRQGTRGLPFNLPGTGFRRALEARVRLSEILDVILRERKARGPVQEGEHEDLLDLLLGAEKLGQTPVTPKQILDQTCISVFAGMETTANTITFAMMYLIESPEILEELKQEHDRIRSRLGESAPISWEDYKEMKFTRMVLNETLRVVNSFPSLFREPLRDESYKGYWLPKGIKLSLDVRSIHTDPLLYPNPCKFDVSRWKTTTKATLGTFIPFGMGAHACVAKELAYLEMAIFLHHAISKYKWEYEEKPKYSFFPSPHFKNNFPVLITRIQDK